MYRIYAKGHHGYPQPEDSYRRELYEEACLRCGIHGRQISPIRLKLTSKASHSSFLQPNWLFDSFLVRPQVEEILTKENISSISFCSVVDSKSGKEIPDLRQLNIVEKIACVECSILPKVRCKVDNEESSCRLALNTRLSDQEPFCGKIKCHPPTKIAFFSTIASDELDLFQSEEWFGSGASAFRLTFCSERFKTLATEQKWRGLGFTKVNLSGCSERQD